MINSDDIELDEAASISGFAGAGASGTDATSVSHLLRPDNAPVETKMHARTSQISSLSKRASWVSSWIYELCAMVISIVFMAAIVIVLSIKIDGKLLSSWTLPLAPNTVIAIFSTLSRSAILLVIAACISQLKWIHFGRRSHRVMDLQIFDDASRGPLGALSLILRIRWGATIASFGALLTILALAQGAFYQQVYSTFSNRTEQRRELASLAVSRYQDTIATDPDWESCKSIMIVSLTIDPRLPYKANSYFSHIRELSASALDGISVSRNPDFRCPSGNCTLSEYQSLGICSTCQDVSKQERKKCWSEKQGDFNEFFCEYTISDDVVVGRDVIFNDPTSVIGTLLNITVAKGKFDDQPRPLISRFGILRVEEDEYWPKRERLEDYADIRLSLYDCELAWCLKTYGTAKVDNGVLEESSPTQSTFLNKAMALNSSMSNCTKINEGVVYKVFPLQNDFDYSNDSDQYMRLSNAFRECPDITTISEEENVFAVNTLDEFGVG